jgi:hypothetical protein
MRAFRDRAFHATLTPKTASPPLPPLSGRFTRTNLRLTPFIHAKTLYGTVIVAVLVCPQTTVVTVHVPEAEIFRDQII